MDNARHSVSSLPVVSKLDHLDFVIKNLEKQHHLTKWNNDNTTHGSTEEPFRPLDTAVRETYFKGSLLERVSALENRLFQLCLELESSGTPTNSTGESGQSSSQRSKREFLRTLPTFSINPKQDLDTNTKSEIQEISQEQEKGEQVEEEVESEKTSENKKKKKGILYKWPHFKLLGC